MKNNIVKTFKSKLIFGKYSLKCLIAKGSIGEVFLGKNILNNKEYALKIEKAKKGESLLKQEAYKLLLLKGPGLPSVISFGQSGKYHILVENLLGESIYNIWLKKKKKLNLKDTCMFAIQALERLEYIHSKNYLHRDIKPGNFLVGNPDKSQIYLIDFGNARKYRSSRTGKHIPFSKNSKMCGTIIFLSTNVLKGIAQTRKDELESLGLVIIYLYKGYLPWSDLKCKDIHQHLDKIKKLKLKISNEELCKDLPKEICEYMNYVKNMNFDENPDYRYLQSLFINILGKTGEKNDLIFSWVDKKAIPRKIICRSNNKSLQKIYKNIFSVNSNKLISISNFDIPFSTSLDNQFLTKNIIKSNNMDLNIEKNNNNSDDNNPNIICNNKKDNDNEKKINFKQKIIHINLEDGDKKTNISRILNNDNCTKKNINYIVNQSVKIDKRKKNLNTKKIILIKNNDKENNTLDINSSLNKNIISKDKIFTTLSNNKQINNPIKEKLNLNLENNNINNNNKIMNYIHINNININKLSDHNYTYLTIYNNPNSPKLNIFQNNLINQTSIHSNKENRMKYIYTKENYKSNKSPNNFHIPKLYKSIFGYHSDSNKEISDITGQLIKKYPTNSQQKYLITKTEKIQNHLKEKHDKRRCIIKTKMLKPQFYLNTKINLYNSPLNNKTGIKFSKSPEQKHL